MLIERSLMPQFLSNTYLVGTPGAEAVFIDAGGPVAPLVAEAERQGLTPTHVLLTHHHHDHVAELGALRERWPGITVLAHPDEAALVEGDVGPITPGEPLEVAGLRVEPLHTPGHTSGMLSFLVEGNVFTGDTLFKGSVGGVRAPGHTTYEDLRRSIMDVLLALPPETVIRPGHTEPTTVADELEANAFVRIWRGVDPEGDEPATALGEPATLVLLGDDYDGGHKAWVRWADGRDDIVPGSQVERTPTRPG
jgi:glyoxylase-like metal-dependent hydrolase (beta-lactamase superfamily II)